MKPVTHYTKSGPINIAYQTFGAGSVDLVYIPGWVSNIDMMWSCPELVSFFTELSKTVRLILFDKRGTGLSDRVVELSTLEERMDDIRAVMDAVGSEKAILFGHSEGGSVSALFAATYPNRTISLITFGVFAKRRYAADYPWAPTDEERQVVYDMIENSWGSGEMNLASLAPSKANDEEFMEWLSSYFRSGASPSAAMVLTKMNTEVDIIDILGSIKVPTLLMQRTQDIDVKIEEGHFIKERIAGAKFIEFEGDDHLFWAGNTTEVLDAMKAFIKEDQPSKVYDEQLFTIVGAKIVAQNSQHKELIGQIVAQYRGHISSFDNNTFLLAFEGPTKAVNCSTALLKALNRHQCQLDCVIHIQEGNISEVAADDNDVKHAIISILEQASPNEILVTQTVKYLLSGAGFNFRISTAKYISNDGDILELYHVSDPNYSFENGSITTMLPSTQHNSFLENVLTTIEKHLNTDYFNVDSLCRELEISERQLQRKLKTLTNKSPNQLISSVRLHRAKELLMNNQNNISEVAFQLGYSNPSYFSKCFKKEFGISPSEIQLTN